MKTHSGIKKRVFVNASGSVKAKDCNKNHKMLRRSPKAMRHKKGLAMLSIPETILVKKIMPYACIKVRRVK